MVTYEEALQENKPAPLVWTLAQLAKGVTVSAPDNVVVARLDVALTVNPDPVLKVNRDEVAIGLVPLPNKISVAVKVASPVPPFCTGKGKVSSGWKVDEA